MQSTPPEPLFNRELSWLKFNERVLQEAEDATVPLLERLNFLAIFSSNLDEFFRVRVASLRSLLRLKKKKVEDLDFNPSKLLKQIYHSVNENQERFGDVYRDEILPRLEAEGIALVDESDLRPEEVAFIERDFDERVRPVLMPIVLRSEDGEVPFLINRALYLIVELWQATGHSSLQGGPRFALIEVPSTALGRFITLPATGDQHRVMFLDDEIRHNLPRLFPAYDVGEAYAVKLTRDAELDLEDEFSGDLVARIRDALSRRDTGIPSRFLYDARMPHGVVRFVSGLLRLEDDDLVPGGRYHNFSDFFSFPRPDRPDLQYEPFPPLPHPELEAARSMREAMEAGDHLLHMPYQSFDYLLRYLREAATDPSVVSVSMTLYRVAGRSAVVEALVEAARNGKTVTAFVELKARFDEESNLYWAEQLERGGVRVLYSLPGLKVHSKAALVMRETPEGRRGYAYFGTGNFNEKTAKVYTDLGLFTADPRLTLEAEQFFSYLEGLTSGGAQPPEFQHLLVAPHAMRKRVYALIEREAEHAAAGKDAWIIAKMNAIEDPKMIRRLYRASQAGVNIRLIVRGICRLIPGAPGLSERIKVRSIVDRFLEHPRIWWFHNGGEEEVYLASADWMTRNLSDRIEVGFPVYDPALREELKTILRINLDDNVKARIIDEEQTNRYVGDVDAEATAGPAIRTQYDTYRLYADRVGVAVPENGVTDGPVDRVQLLQRVPAFAGLDEEVRWLLAELLEEEQVAAGTLLASDGDPAMYIVGAGDWLVDPGRRLLRSGQTFGEASLLAGSPQLTVSPRALTDGTLFLIRESVLFDEERVPPRLALSIVRALGAAASRTGLPRPT